MANRKVKYDFDPIKGRDIPNDRIDQVRDDIKAFVKESILSKVGEGVSPVSGQGSFKKLSKKYAVKMKGGNRLANLELTGDMLDGLEIADGPGGVIRVTIEDDEQPKADGHNNFSGKSKLPRRAFIPDEKRDEVFKADIERGIEAIVRRYENG